jgi:hypothetical protein
MENCPESLSPVPTCVVRQKQKEGAMVDTASVPQSGFRISQLVLSSLLLPGKKRGCPSKLTPPFLDLSHYNKSLIQVP